MRRLRLGSIFQSFLLSLIFCSSSFPIIYIDINAPSIKKLKVAIADFFPMDMDEKRKDLSERLPMVIRNDLLLSGYFKVIEKEAYLTKKTHFERPNLADWSAIGADLLIVGRYRTIGESLQVEVRMYDVYWGKRIFGKRALGKVRYYRYVMHRIDDEIIKELTGEEGIFSTKIAFVSDRTGNKEIYIADYDGYNVKQITFHRSISILPSISPDGKKLVYTSYTKKGPVLYIKDLESGKERILSSRPGLNSAASWSPDGKMLAITLSLKGNPDIYLIDTEGNIIKRLTKYWGIDTAPCFSPDGKKIAFVSNRSGSPQIYVHELETGREYRITYEGKYNSSPSWSKLNIIAYSCMIEDHFDICTIKPDGTDMKRLTRNKGNDENPCWSPDGRYIIFTSNRTGRYQLYIMTANGMNQTRITSFEGNQTDPFWSR